MFFNKNHLESSSELNFWTFEKILSNFYCCEFQVKKLHLNTFTLKFLVCDSHCDGYNLPSSGRQPPLQR